RGLRREHGAPDLPRGEADREEARARLRCCCRAQGQRRAPSGRRDPDEGSSEARHQAGVKETTMAMQRHHESFEGDLALPQDQTEVQIVSDGTVGMIVKSEV